MIIGISEYWLTHLWIPLVTQWVSSYSALLAQAQAPHKHRKYQLGWLESTEDSTKHYWPSLSLTISSGISVGQPLIKRVLFFNTHHKRLCITYLTNNEYNIQNHPQCHICHNKLYSTYLTNSSRACYCLRPVLHISEGGVYTRPEYGVGCYMKFNPCVNSMYWVFDDRKKIIKSKICIWMWVNFFVFYTFLCDLWFGHFEWFLIFPKVLHSFDGVVVVGGQQIGKTPFLCIGSDFVFVSVPIVDALTVLTIPQTLKMELKQPRYRGVKHSYI